jgi:hypothetical protein
MLYQAFYTEILKYKRTLIPWLVLVGGSFPVLVALLFLLTSGVDVTWEALAGTALSYLNMLALLFTAVIAGYAFVAEYRDSRVNMSFAYPVPRVLLYVVKTFTVLLPVLGMYLVFLACVAASGWIFARRPPEIGFASDMLALLGLSVAASFSLVPTTAVLSTVVKNAGAYILAGVGYFIVFMSLAGSECGKYAPPCVPDRLLKDYLASGHLVSADAGGMLLACAAVFLLAFVLGAALYTRLEI